MNTGIAVRNLVSFDNLGNKLDNITTSFTLRLLLVALGKQFIPAEAWPDLQ